MYGDVNHCMVCGRELKDTASIDLWALVSVYNEDGEPVKTGEPIQYSVPGGEWPDDYLVIGLDCCGHVARGLWSALVTRLKEVSDDQ